jgi:hypothetical protein
MPTTLIPDLLTSFLSSRKRWSGSDVMLARKVLQRLRPSSGLTQFRQDPALIMELAGLSPDPWQRDLLRFPSPMVLLNCSRQSGKSTVAAAMALQAALLQAPALVLLLSPTLRQSMELFGDKVLPLYNTLGRPVPTLRPRDNMLQLRLANGSRIVSLPGDSSSVRGYSNVRLLVIDEGARVDDGLYYAVRPMLAVSRGRLVALSTPFGRQGWFFEQWRGPEPWQRVKITAEQCPRIPRDFLAEERRAIGERWYAQEYECEFMEIVGAVFSGRDIEAALAKPVATVEFPE